MKISQNRDTTRVNRCWNKSPIYTKSCPKSSYSSFYSHRGHFSIHPKIKKMFRLLYVQCKFDAKTFQKWLHLVTLNLPPWLCPCTSSHCHLVRSCLCLIDQFPSLTMRLDQVCLTGSCGSQCLTTPECFGGLVCQRKRCVHCKTDQDCGIVRF